MWPFSKKSKEPKDYKLAEFSWHYINRYTDCFICNICSAYVEDFKKHRSVCKFDDTKHDLESISVIAERVFPKEIAEIKSTYSADLNDDRIKENLWYNECNESARLNRKGY